MSKPVSAEQLAREAFARCVVRSLMYKAGATLRIIKVEGVTGALILPLYPENNQAARTLITMLERHEDTDLDNPS